VKRSPWVFVSGAAFFIAAVLSILYFEQGSLWWMAVGAVLSASLLSCVLALQDQTPSLPNFQEKLQKLAHLEQQAALWEAKAAEQAALVSQEKDRLVRKTQEALDKAASYQRLVEVHRKEIEILKTDIGKMGEASLAKTRRISQLELYLEDPRAFPEGDQEAAFLYTQLKTHAEEKERALEQVQGELHAVENRLKSLQAELEEKAHDQSAHEFSLVLQMQAIEEEKQQLAGELSSVQQVVSKLSQKEETPVIHPIPLLGLDLPPETPRPKTARPRKPRSPKK